MGRGAALAAVGVRVRRPRSRARQAGLGLPEALGRAPAPVRFVNSLGLGEPAGVRRPIGRRLERYPGLRFKLDAQASWSPELAAEVAATGAVDIIDFKGRYELPVDDESALLAMYETVRRALPRRDPRGPPRPPRCRRAARAARGARLVRRADRDPGRHRGGRVRRADRQRQAFADRRPARAARTSTRTASRTACGCTAAGWASSASAAGRSSCSPRSSIPTGPTTSRRRPTTCPTCPRAAAEPARAAAGADGVSLGRLMPQDCSGAGDRGAADLPGGATAAIVQPRRARAAPRCAPGSNARAATGRSLRSTSRLARLASPLRGRGRRGLRCVARLPALARGRDPAVARSRRLRQRRWAQRPGRAGPQAAHRREGSLRSRARAAPDQRPGHSPTAASYTRRPAEQYVTERKARRPNDIDGPSRAMTHQ